jgi:hypothetical protein
MTGGYIKNAALRAAFLAADEGTAIAMRHLVRAARAEYQAMGKVRGLADELRGGDQQHEAEDDEDDGGVATGAKIVAHGCSRQV